MAFGNGEMAFGSSKGATVKGPGMKSMKPKGMGMKAMSKKRMVTKGPRMKSGKQY